MFVNFLFSDVVAVSTRPPAAQTPPTLVQTRDIPRSIDECANESVEIVFDYGAKNDITVHSKPVSV